ncbi:hypothetical protein Clacol_009142 [Clathrus columnatus]|uniref:Uncharacterized protein n=1 Tax=Clathrus columnatus TaxID=1419009 RepID=A0AAV5AP96_9AGAM|nr:hypothetical protein Clacol_009142 [Clathrus columnatus]
MASAYFTYTDIVIFALLNSRQHSAAPQHLDTLQAEIQLLKERNVIHLGRQKSNRVVTSIICLMENNILMHPDKKYIDLTVKGKRNLTLATIQLGSFYELKSRSKQKKFLKMLADPTLSGSLRKTKAKENLNIPEVMAIFEKAIQNLVLKFGELSNEVHITFEKLTSNQFHQGQMAIEALEPPSTIEEEMVPDPPLPVGSDTGSSKESLNPQGTMDESSLDAAQDVEMSDTNEVDNSLPVITGPEEVPLTIEQTRTEIKRLQEEIDKIEAQFSEAIQKLGRLEGENTTLREQNSTLTQENTTLTGKILTLTEQIVTLTGLNNTSTARVATLTEQNAALQTTNADLSGQNSRLSLKIESMKSQAMRFHNYVASSLANFNFCSSDESDLPKSSSVRDSGVGLYPDPIDTPISPPPSSP